MGDQSIETTKIVSRKTVPTKTVPTNFNKKEIACKTKKILYFTYHFINYCSIIDSC